MKEKGKSTISVHSGQLIDEKTQGMVSPIYPSTSFDYLDTDQLSYPRYFNTPNQKSVAKKIAELESGEDCLITSSGMAAISTVLFSLLRKGDHAIFQKGLYGGTHHAILNEFEKFGIEYSFAANANEEDIVPLVKENTKVLYFETPTNPLLKITDLREVASVAANHKLVTVVDNTFASPINQNPLKFGIDVVIHSGTKYLGGHSDLSCGAIISSKSIIEKCWNSAIHFGGNLNALSVYLLERSLKTLAIRVRQQNRVAMDLASFLQNHELVTKVNYPGLSTHENHQVASTQMEGYGGMLSFELDLQEPEIYRFLKSLKTIHSAMSLGGVETIISSPAKTSHSKMSVEDRIAIGITDGLLRMSVGIEDVEDLKADLEMALKKSTVLV